LAFRWMGPDLLLLDRHFVDAHIPVAARQSSSKHIIHAYAIASKSCQLI